MTETTNNTDAAGEKDQNAESSSQNLDQDSVSTAHQRQQRPRIDDSIHDDDDDDKYRNHSLMDDHADDSDEEQAHDDADIHSSPVLTNASNDSGTNDTAAVAISTHQASNQVERVSTAVASLFQTNNRRYTKHATPPPHRWDHFVRSGTRLKTLLEDTMSEVKTSIISSARRQNNKRGRDVLENGDDDDNEELNPRVVAVADFTAELAREKTAQVLQLKRVSKQTNCRKRI
jgi:hypothetical protein